MIKINIHTSTSVEHWQTRMNNFLAKTAATFSNNFTTMHIKHPHIVSYIVLYNPRNMAPSNMIPGTEFGYNETHL